MLVTWIGAARWLHSRGLSASDVVFELGRPDGPRFEWRSVDRKHWQVVAAAGEDLTPVDPSALAQGDGLGCPAGMARVAGEYRAGVGPGSLEVERLQDSACVEWLNTDFPARCSVFDQEKIAAGLKSIRTRPIDVCVDRFEYPNVAGESPIIVVTFREAETLCKASGKRLCTEDEWTFACEGEEAWPYPYGFTRDDSACVMDRAWRPFTEGALSPRDGSKAREELDRLWQGERSGARPACKSPFGVYDLAGNVDEWTRSTRSSGYASILKGGYWGPVRARCRPATRAHGEDFVAYQQGFRCCAEPEAMPEPTPAPTGDADAAAPSPEATANAEGDAAPAPEATAIAEADAGPTPAGAPLAPEPSANDVEETGDELEGLARRRRKLQCGVARGAVTDGRGLTELSLAGLALAFVLRRRRSRAR